jgi:uncharacterized protein (TIGR03435 family)
MLFSFPHPHFRVTLVTHLRLENVMKPILLMLMFAMAVMPATSQTPAQKPAFEVASIKPSDPDQHSGSIMIQPGGRLAITGMPLRELVKFAYSLQDFQLEGGPAWARTDFWNVEARAEEPPSPNPNQPNMAAVRLRSLLEDRFQLRAHRESRDVPVYELTISKRGSKMKLSADQTPARPPEPGEPQPLPIKPSGSMDRFSLRVGRGSLEAVAMDMPRIIQALSSILRRTVVDKTGLKGLYDVKLQWTPEGGVVPAPGLVGPVAPDVPVDRDGPTLFTAIQEQLGLNLESAKAPVEVLVIDSVQRPSEN